MNMQEQFPGVDFINFSGGISTDLRGTLLQLRTQPTTVLTIDMMNVASIRLQHFETDEAINAGVFINSIVRGAAAMTCIYFALDREVTVATAVNLGNTVADVHNNILQAWLSVKGPQRYQMPMQQQPMAPQNPYQQAFNDAMNPYNPHAQQQPGWYPQDPMPKQSQGPSGPVPSFTANRRSVFSQDGRPVEGTSQRPRDADGSSGIGSGVMA